MADIIFTGNLGADSVIKYTPSGSPVLNFRAADTKSKKNSQGGWDKVSEQWFGVELWGSTAEFLAEHLKTGVRVKVYGQFYARQYEGRNGSGTALEVKASAVEIITSSKDRQKLAANPPPAQEDPWGAPADQGWGGQPTTQGGWGTDSGATY